MPAIVNAKTLTTFVWSVVTGTVFIYYLDLFYDVRLQRCSNHWRKKQIRNLWMKLDIVLY